jgi:hypothetical protein
MKICTSPIEIWHSEPSLRTFLKQNNIVREDENGKVSIPAFKCNIEKPTEGSKVNKHETRLYPFWHQKLQFMLDSMEGDYIRACESFNDQNRSIIVGKNMEIIVTLM